MKMRCSRPSRKPRQIILGNVRQIDTVIHILWAIIIVVIELFMWPEPKDNRDKIK